jgi:imidazole glycerol-phosphate synthase subunit HisF
MLSVRTIPVLLLSDGAAVKTRQFANPIYIGDIVNAASIFNSKMADELMVLDINASRRGSLALDRVRDLAEECFMPLCYGGGISNMKDASSILRSGMEKISINSHFHETGELVRDAADEFGSSSVVVSIDVREERDGCYQVYSRSGTRALGIDPVDQAKRAVDAGAGEIVIQSIDRDGMRTGYDTALVKAVADAVPIPVVALGGARDISDMADVVSAGGAATAAAGSMFVLYGRLKAVLITYPDEKQRNAAFAATQNAKHSGAL